MRSVLGSGWVRATAAFLLALTAGCSDGALGTRLSGSQDPMSTEGADPEGDQSGAVPLPAAQSRPSTGGGEGFSSQRGDGGVTVITTPPPPSPSPSPTPSPSTYPSTSPSPSPSSSTPSDPYAAARDFCVQRVNQYRASIGVAPLTAVASAGSCADQQAQYDAANNTAHGAFSYCNEFAQNECPGWGGSLTSALPGCLDAMWREGPGGGHYQNMANPNYRYAVCGIYQTANGGWWVVQDFR